jgi:hypothetical protein
MAKIPAKNDVLFKRAWKKSLLNSTANGQSLDDLAKLCGLADSSLYATASEERPDAWISLRRFLAILPELKDLAVLDYLESIVTPRRVGYPVPEDANRLCSTKVAAQWMRKMADVLDIKAKALEDDEWYDDEAAEFSMKVEDFARCLLGYADHAKRMAKPRDRNDRIRMAGVA